MLRNRIFNAASSALGHLQLCCTGYAAGWRCSGNSLPLPPHRCGSISVLPLLPLLGIVAAHFLFNLATCWQIRRQLQPPHYIGLTAAAGADCGGYRGVDAAAVFCRRRCANPFVSLYLLPISIAAAILPAGAVIGLLLLTLLCYSGLMLWHVPLPHIHAFGHDQFWGTRSVAWLTFVIAAAVMVVPATGGNDDSPARPAIASGA